MKRKGEKDISKNWADDEIEISINLWVQCYPQNLWVQCDRLIKKCKNITMKIQDQNVFSLPKINFQNNFQNIFKQIKQLNKLKQLRKQLNKYQINLLHFGRIMELRNTKLKVRKDLA